MVDRRAFVIGDPIAHSKSPIIHSHWLTQHAIDGVYEAIHVIPEELHAFLDHFSQDAAITGGNVTIPHKQSVHAWLTERSDARISQTASRLKAVNTLYKRDGFIIGDNTDGYGFAANLDDRLPQWQSHLSEIVIIGAGGASRAVVASLDERRPKDAFIRIANRTVERAEALIHDLKLEDAAAHGLEELSSLATHADFVVNTSSMGMEGGEGPSIIEEAVGQLNPASLATDIVYTPLVTPFLRSAAATGARTADGLGMLLHQAVPGFEAWFGVRPKVTEELRSLVLDAMQPR
ncbi:MAG: shikimate dehydrogenase [Pseudomonadota bacterium]